MSAPDWVWQLVDLAAAQAARNYAAMDQAFEKLLAEHHEAAVEEALLQSYLFLGFPSAIEAFRRWRTHGVEPPGAARENPSDWERRGERVCETVYRGRYEKLRENIARFHPDLDSWMVVEGYGKVLGRPGLGLDVREMLIVAMLVVEGAGVKRQLWSHLQGARNAGVADADIEAVMRRAARFAAPENLELAERLWSAVRTAA